MKKLLIGYVAVTLLGTITIALEMAGIGVMSFLSGSHIFSMFTVPEFFLIGSFFADHTLGQFRVEMIPPFLFLMTMKLTVSYGLGSALSYLWNFKLKDVS